MSWKYAVIPDKDMVKVVEMYDNCAYAEHTENDWLFNNIDEAIEMFEMIVEDLRIQRESK